MHICLTPQRSLVLATLLVLAPLALSAQAADDRVPGDEWTKDEPGQRQFPGSQWDSGGNRSAQVPGSDWETGQDTDEQIPGSNWQNNQDAQKQIPGSEWKPSEPPSTEQILGSRWGEDRSVR